MTLDNFLPKVLELEYIISGVCGLLLVIIILALVFKNSFRKDMVAGEGKANLFGVSVEGAIIVVLSGMFLAGLVYPLYKSNSGTDNTLNEFLQSLPINPHTEQVVRDRVMALLEMEGNFEAMKAEKLQLINDMKESVLQSDLDEFIKKLSPESTLSLKLLAVEKNNLGPWSPSSTAKKVLISVPGDHKKGSNYSCNEYHGKMVEFISNYKVGDMIIKGKSKIKLRINGLMSSAPNCREIINYDFQFSCQDAVELFSKEVLTCDKTQKPLWKINGRKVLSAYATKIYNTGHARSPVFISGDDKLFIVKDGVVPAIF